MVFRTKDSGTVAILNPYQFLVSSDSERADRLLQVGVGFFCVVDSSAITALDISIIAACSAHGWFFPQLLGDLIVSIV